MLKKIFFIALVSILMGCASYQEDSSVDQVEKLPESNLITICDAAVNDLVKNCKISIDKEKAIIVTSLVSVNNLEQSSSMGRMAGEILANKLSQRGYTVKELKMGQNKIFIKKGQGEFVLSRKLQEIAKSYDVQAVVVGTYAVGEELESKKYGETMLNRPLTKLYLSIRMVTSNTDNICSSTAQSMTITNARLWGY